MEDDLVRKEAARNAGERHGQPSGERYRPSPQRSQRRVEAEEVEEATQVDLKAFTQNLFVA